MHGGAWWAAVHGVTRSRTRLSDFTVTFTPTLNITRFCICLCIFLYQEFYIIIWSCGVAYQFFHFNLKDSFKHFLGFPGGSAGKESSCDVGDLGSIPGLGRSPGEGNGYNSRILASRIPWTEEPGWATVHGVTKSRTRLGN